MLLVSKGIQVNSIFTIHIKGPSYVSGNQNFKMSVHRYTHFFSKKGGRIKEREDQQRTFDSRMYDYWVSSLLLLSNTITLLSVASNFFLRLLSYFSPRIFTVLPWLLFVQVSFGLSVCFILVSTYLSTVKSVYDQLGKVKIARVTKSRILQLKYSHLDIVHLLLYCFYLLYSPYM